MFSNIGSLNWSCKFCCRYCPNCKEHKQASEKLRSLDVTRDPCHSLEKIFIHHILRQTETFLDLPVDDFDLSNYRIQKNDVACHH